MSGQAHEDIGYHGRPTPWDDVKDVACPRCKAEVGKPCINPACGKPSHVPCFARIRAAEVLADKLDHWRER